MALGQHGLLGPHADVSYIRFWSLQAYCAACCFGLLWLVYDRVIKDVLQAIMVLCNRAIKDVLCAPPSHWGLSQPLEHLRACIKGAVETR